VTTNRYYARHPDLLAAVACMSMPCRHFVIAVFSAVAADDLTGDVHVKVSQVGHERMVGAQPEGGWRSVTAAAAARICTEVLTSASQGDFDWHAARMLTR
jgi:hypothetical protein